MKFTFTHSIRPLVAALFLLYGTPSFGNGVEKIHQPAPRLQLSPEQRAAHVDLLRQTEMRTQNIFLLLNAEMRVTQNKPALALQHYLQVLSRTQDAQVAERAFFLAVESGNYQQAEELYQSWRAFETGSSVPLRRVEWTRALANGELDELAKNTSLVLKEADSILRNQMFLVLAREAILHQRGAELYSKVQRAIWQYPDDLMAMITAAILASAADKEDETVRAVLRIIDLDEETSELETLATMGSLLQANPRILQGVEKKRAFHQLPSAWQLVWIDFLEEQGDFAKALTYVETLLNEQADTDFYMKAVTLASRLPNSDGKVNQYLEKAYHHANPNQRSRIVLWAAVDAIDKMNFQAASEWLKRDASAEYRFDKNLLEALLAAEKKDWQSVRLFLQGAKRYPNEKSGFFEGKDQWVRFALIEQQDLPELALQELEAWLHELDVSEEDLRESLLYQRALLYADVLGQPEKAIMDLRLLLSQHPNKAEYQNALGYTLLSMGKKHLDEAFGLIQAAYLQMPTDPAINDSMGWVYFLKGDAQQAEWYLKFAYERYPDAEVAAHLAEVWWQLGERERALVLLRKTWQENPHHRLLQETLRRLGIENEINASENEK